MQDENSIATGSITVIKMMGKGHGKDKLIKTYFNGKEASVMHDTCSSVSTVHYDDPTKSRIIRIGRKRTCSRVCIVSNGLTESKKEGRRRTCDKS